MDTLLKHTSNLYGLNLQYHEKVKKGSLSENHILIDGDTRYFLKQYAPDAKEKVEEIQSVKRYFSDGNIPVILPITNKEGSTYFSFEDGCYALFPFVLDKQLSGKELTETAIVSLGEMLGKIHLLGRDAKLPVSGKFKPWNKEKSLAKIELVINEIQKKTNFDDFDESALKSLNLKKQLVQENTVVYEDLNLSSDHLIHGDYTDHNVFFGGNDKISWVFDFEKTSYSPRTHELFKCMMYSFLCDDLSEENISRAKLYLDSYRKTYPISEDELTRGLKLYYLKSIHGLWSESEHYLNDNHRVDKFLGTDFPRIDNLSEHFEEFRNSLF